MFSGKETQARLARVCRRVQDAVSSPPDAPPSADIGGRLRDRRGEARPTVSATCSSRLATLGVRGRWVTADVGATKQD